jgi:hypothetical protein
MCPQNMAFTESVYVHVEFYIVCARNCKQNPFDKLYNYNKA